MKTKYILLAFTALFFSCLKDEMKMPNVKPVAEGVFQIDNIEYKWVQIGNLQWMVENMNIEPQKGEFTAYAESDQSDTEKANQQAKNLKKHGYLYNYEAAMSVAPEGWRLASDQDWKQLEKELGLNAQQANAVGWRGEKEGWMLQQVESGTKLALSMGGMQNYLGVRFYACMLGVSGMYWTSTADENRDINAYYRQIRFDTPQICRNTTLKLKFMSVRCVRDAK